MGDVKEGMLVMDLFMLTFQTSICVKVLFYWLDQNWAETEDKTNERFIERFIDQAWFEFWSTLPLL